VKAGGVVSARTGLPATLLSPGEYEGRPGCAGTIGEMPDARSSQVPQPFS